MNEIQQIQLMKERDVKDKAIRRNLNIANKQILVAEKQRKYETPQSTLCVMS